jgi:hypothetical protein
LPSGVFCGVLSELLSGVVILFGLYSCPRILKVR